MKTISIITILAGFCVTLNAQIINIPADQPTIQAGINASNEGDTILVAEGTYYENINFLGKAITVASHFILDSNQTHIENTIIDGSQFTNPDSSAVVTFCSGEDTSSMIKGVTIQGGKGTFNNIGYAKLGGGIYLCNSGATISNNRIRENHLSDASLRCGGAGISSVMDTGNYWVTIEDNVICNNSTIANAESSFGGGIYTTINAIIRNNIIEQNYCYNAGEIAEGGGIEVQQLPGTTISILIDNNTIKDNKLECEKTWGGGIIIYYASATVTNNIIQNNKNNTDEKSWGAGLLCAFTTDQILICNNLFSGNIGPNYPDAASAGGGIGIRDAYEGKVIVDGNIFMYNESKHGAGFFERNSYNIQLTNNVFIENVAYIGGGIGMFQNQVNPGETRPQIINNTFKGNYADVSGGAIRVTGDNGDEVITFNNLYWENESHEGNDIYNNTFDDPIYVSYSNLDESGIHGPWSGDSNMNENPLFIDDLCHLDKDSPCVDAGIDSLEFTGNWYFAPEVDYEGTPRPYNGGIDIGADEWDITTGIHDSFTSSRKEMIIMQNYPNPFINFTTIHLTLPDASFVNLEICDITGKIIKTLHSGFLQTREHRFAWIAEGCKGGIYFLRLQTNEISETKKLLLHK